MSSIGYRSKEDEVNKLIARLNQIISRLEERLNKLEKKVG
tara:strand:+ start:543 stop:662 length:120 start_codon:yes stop_codon:yes gene_type:complete